MKRLTDKIHLDLTGDVMFYGKNDNYADKTTLRRDRMYQLQGYTASSGSAAIRCSPLPICCWPAGVLRLPNPVVRPEYRRRETSRRMERKTGLRDSLVDHLARQSRCESELISTSLKNSLLAFRQRTRGKDELLQDPGDISSGDASAGVLRHRTKKGPHPLDVIALRRVGP